MRKKILIQILLLLLVFLIVFSVYQIYFKSFSDQEIVLVEEENKDEKSNLVNITYESVDTAGKKYIINAETGSLDEKNPDLIYMSKVKAKIILLDGSVVYISSLKAEYNTLNYDTKFLNDIMLNFLENDIYCNNFNIF